MSMTTAHTSTWFQNLRRNERKELLAMLHQARLAGMKDKLLLGLLRALEDDHTEVGGSLPSIPPPSST